MTYYQPVERSMSSRLIAFMVIVVMGITGTASADTLTLPAEQEAQARALFKDLHCMVCNGQSLVDSDAQLAVDMRDLIRKKIASGEKPEAITQFLTSRYGEAILMEPPFNPMNWVLWLAPLALLIGGGTWIFRCLFAKKPPHPPHDGHTS